MIERDWETELQGENVVYFSGFPMGKDFTEEVLKSYL